MKTAKIKDGSVSRRRVLLAGLVATGGVATTANGATAQMPSSTLPSAAGSSMGSHGNMMTVGDVNNEANGFDPMALLTNWDVGTTEIFSK